MTETPKGRTLTAIEPLGPVQRGSDKTPTEIRRHRHDDGRALDTISGDRLLQALYESKGSLLRACRRVGIAYKTAERWFREDAELREGRTFVETCLADDAHRLFMEKVLADKTPPAYPIFYLKSTDPRYAERKGSHGGVTLNFTVTDGSLRPAPRAIGATVTKALPGEPHE